MRARDLGWWSSEPVCLVSGEVYENAWRIDMHEHEFVYVTTEESYQADKRFNEACDHIIDYPDDMNGWVYLALMCVKEADRALTLQSLYVQGCMDLACE